LDESLFVLSQSSIVRKTTPYEGDLNAGATMSNSNPEYALDFIIRAAQPEDVEGMVAIWTETTEQLAQADPRWKLAEQASIRWEAAMRSWLRDSTRVVFVAVRRQQVLAYIVGSITENTPGLLPERIGVVNDLAADSHGRGNGGIGTELLKALEGWLRERGITYLQAFVPASHPIAQAFWRVSGATVVAHHMIKRLRD